MESRKTVLEQARRKEYKNVHTTRPKAKRSALVQGRRQREGWTETNGMALLPGLVRYWSHTASCWLAVAKASEPAAPAAAAAAALGELPAHQDRG